MSISGSDPKFPSNPLTNCERKDAREILAGALECQQGKLDGLGIAGLAIDYAEAGFRGADFLYGFDPPLELTSIAAIGLFNEVNLDQVENGAAADALLEMAAFTDLRRSNNRIKLKLPSFGPRVLPTTATYLPEWETRLCDQISTMPKIIENMIASIDAYANRDSRNDEKPIIARWHEIGDIALGQSSGF